MNKKLINGIVQQVRNVEVEKRRPSSDAWDTSFLMAEESAKAVVNIDPKTLIDAGQATTRVLALFRQGVISRVSPLASRPRRHIR